MDEKSVVLHLSRNGWRAQLIRDDLVATLCEEAIPYSRVKKCLSEAIVSLGDTTLLPDASSIQIDESDEDIMRALEEPPFSSIQIYQNGAIQPNL
jgi:hypothetical protein